MSIISNCFRAYENETGALAEFYSVLEISRAIGKEVNHFKRSDSKRKRLRRRMRYERRRLLERTIREHFPNVCVINQLGRICLHKDKADAEKHHSEFRMVDSFNVFNVTDLESVIERNGGSICRKSTGKGYYFYSFAPFPDDFQPNGLLQQAMFHSAYPLHE